MQAYNAIMKTKETKNQGSHTEKTLWDFARESTFCFDELDQQDQENVSLLAENKENRDSLAEFRADQMFCVAAKVCRDLLDHEDDMIRLGAVKEIFKLRAITLKCNKKEKIEDKKTKAVYDGFTFASGN